MTITEFYEAIGGDYTNTKQRFLADERILRFVRKFPLDGSFQSLKDNLAAGDIQEAFRAAHTLKGVAQNLGFTVLYTHASDVTELLRAGNADVQSLMPKVEENYRLILESIPKLEG